MPSTALLLTRPIIDTLCCSKFATCDKCNQGLCGWCGTECMTDSDGNSKVCGDHSDPYTGSMDDCPSS